MVVGVLEIRGIVRQSRSLKEKRRVVKSVKDRLSGKFNISVAEVDYLDSRQQIGLGISLVGKDQTFVDSSLNHVIHFLSLSPTFELIDYNLEFV